MQGWADTETVAGDKPSALAVSLISPGSFVDWTMTCARPLNTLRDHADAAGLPTSSTFTSGFRPPDAGFVQDAHGDDVVARVQGFLDVVNRLRGPVGGFADALVVDENPAVIVNAAEPDLHAGIGQVGLGQVDVRAENGRLAFAQNLVAGVAVGLGLDHVPG